MAYKAYRRGKDGELVPVTTQEAAYYMRMPEKDLRTCLRAMTLVREICTAVGMMESPPLVWDSNMPKRLMAFVTDRVAEELKANPGYSADDFDVHELYDDNMNLRFKD